MHRKKMMHAVVIMFLCLILSNNAFSITLSGQVLDDKTGNPLGNVTVRMVSFRSLQTGMTEDATGPAPFDMTDLAGRFAINAGNQSGYFTLEFSRIGYRSTKDEFLFEQFPVTLRLIPAIITLSEVVVTVGRSKIDQSPGALSDISREMMDTRYGVQDVPLVVNEIPSATAFSWSGSDAGAAEIRIRGFGQDRISATVNGVPINDPEDHNLYWQDTPDFLSNTYDIQVQRGVSSFVSGPAGVGGGLNLVTSDAVSNRELAFTYQAGSFETERRTLAYRSGIVEGKYNFTGRFSRVTTDGYRDHTAADMWSYFLGAARFDENMVTRMQIYGGQEEMDAYWWGLDKSTLEKNRRANYSARYKDYMGEYFWEETVDYHDEKDYFEQPHYMLQNQWRLNSDLELNQSLFYIRGDGYYEEWKFNRKFSEYNLTPYDVIRDEDEDGILDTVTVNRTDLIRRKYVGKDHYGWLPRLNWSLSPDAALEAGLEIRNFASEHYGKVMWARNLPAGVQPQNEWYRWDGRKDYRGGFANLTYSLNEQMTLNAGLQYRQVKFAVDQQEMGAFPGYEYDLTWNFVNPRLGLKYKLNPKTSFYASFAGAGREPVDDQIYDPDNPADIPKLSVFNQQEIDPEQMWDLELGARRQFKNGSMGVNFYGMFFTNEIVKLGFSSELDAEIIDNAPTSRHIGIEVDGNWNTPVEGLSLGGNVSYGVATLGDYEILHTWSDENWETHTDTLNLDGNAMALFPNLIGNLRLSYTTGPAIMSLHLQHVSKQYMDNREDDEAMLDPYTTVDGTMILKLKELKFGEVDLELRGMNLFDEEYEPFGTVDVEYGTPYYVPAAGRRYLAGISLKL